jgi:TolB-like protein/DNA-binding winged helix-turn-helix (wHTH) protein
MIYEFGEFELDTVRRVLVTRAGAPVDITGRVLDALIYLVERPGQLVDKKALIDALWPNVVVEDGNLSQTIHTLRRVLGEKAGEHRYIVTVPGRGYQFVAEVEARDARAKSDAPAASETHLTPDAEPPRRPKLLLVGGALVLVSLVVAVLAWRGRDQPVHEAAVVAHPSIAVLPFVDMSQEQDEEHFAEGLSEEILNVLARADNLRVIARTSSFSFKGENVDIRTIAQRLDVTHVLEGSVRKSGDRLRITAQLIDVSTSAHVWSDTYDRDIHDIFGVQREIAAAVADALRVKLARAAPRSAETTSTEAYEHYLQGRLLFNRRSGSDLLQAKTHFEQATQIDPSYGRAWAALAGVYFVARYDNKVDLPDAMQKWGDAAERAVALSPELAEAHIRAAQYYSNSGKPDVAHKYYARAAALDPEDPLVLGVAMSDAIMEGRLEDAVRIQRHLLAIDPLSANNRGNLGMLLTSVGRLAEAQTELERALELSPAGISTTSGIADVLILQGRADEALAVTSTMPDGYLRDERLAMARFARGDVREGSALLASLRAQAEKPDFNPGLPVAIAEIYASRNDLDHAFEWLERARPRTPRQIEMLPAWSLREILQLSPFLKSLHADPRWGELLTVTTDAP